MTSFWSMQTPPGCARQFLYLTLPYFTDFIDFVDCTDITKNDTHRKMLEKLPKLSRLSLWHQTDSPNLSGGQENIVGGTQTPCAGQLGGLWPITWRVAVGLYLRRVDPANSAPS